MTASEHTELLPCPHCGGKAIQSRESDQWLEHYHHHFIRCSECNAQSAKFHANVDDSHGAVQKAIAAWNRRALPDGAEPVPVAWRHPEPVLWSDQTQRVVDQLRAEMWKIAQAVGIGAGEVYSADTIIDRFASPTGMGVTEEQVDRACPAVCEDTSFGIAWVDLLWLIRNEADPIKRGIAEQKRDRVRRIARAALTAALHPTEVGNG